MRSKKSKHTARKSKHGASPTKAAAAQTADTARVAEVLLWTVQGHTEAHIAEAIRAKWPDAEARPLIAAALEKLTACATPDAALVRGWCLEAYRELHRRLTEMGDYAAAIRAVSKIEELGGNQAEGPADSEGTAGNPDIDAARAHLAPLFDDGDTLPLPELCRLAAARILNRE